MLASSVAFTVKSLGLQTWEELANLKASALLHTPIAQALKSSLGTINNREYCGRHYGCDDCSSAVLLPAELENRFQAVGLTFPCYRLLKYLRS